jgi:DNA-binding CsgD family transcriptional regulator
MAGSGQLHDVDLPGLVAVIEGGLRDDPGEAMPWAVLGGLRRLVPSQMMIFQETDLGESSRSVALQLEAEGGQRSFSEQWEPPYPGYWADREKFKPAGYLDRTGDLTSVLRYSDFYSFSALKNLPIFADFLQHNFGSYGLIVPLPAPPGRIRRLHLGRFAQPDFSDRDVMVLRLLRPHLHEVYLHAERRRRGVPHLSRRECEVLQLAAGGHSNADIARMLFISVGTVAKHMEHIFDRTGVRNRRAAAALAVPQINPFHSPPDARQ